MSIHQSLFNIWFQKHCEEANRLMDIETAKEYLSTPDNRKLTELGEAVETLYQEYGSYKKIAIEVNMSAERLSQFHRVFLLPNGIRWKIEEGKIPLSHAWQISRLDKENDQWLLTFSIVTKRLNADDIREVVNTVIKHNRPINDVLHDLIGIRFDQVDEPLLLPFSFMDRFNIARAAWDKKLNWPDFCLKAIKSATRVDLEQIANEMKQIVSKINMAEDGTNFNRNI